MLCNNPHKRKEVKWWCNGSPGDVSSAIVREGSSNYAKINIKERRQRGACHLDWKGQHDGSTGGIISAMVRGGSDDNNGNNDDDDDDAEMMTMMTRTSMAAGTVGINAGMDTAAVLHQGSTMPGKCS
jgi:hypothetical protein